ncbi:hypothetical protein H310_09998 [Aphanomyces invadans]|uniref:Cyclic nucleotide-binding domain-containing protein n=1 Tax=Aphanomyces invadans TaxID=157072 RepID=A0A024TST1_9STRA|nr:hypothetical protein H310_09998 [Aphanomyces invadans]ETV97210.1 hypothetical protein H310_09998 [Aphanomyces invadans]|eukprot:XP_008874456.1 hypothetical protein H310_09998 [Aphanomyces invadans]
MAAHRRSKRPTLGALEEVEEVEPAEPTTPGGTSSGKKRLQLTIKNVLMRAQVTRLFTDKAPTNLVVPESFSTTPPSSLSVRLAPIVVAPQKSGTGHPTPLTPPPLMLNHFSTQNGNIWSTVVRKATLKQPGDGSAIASPDEVDSVSDSAVADKDANDPTTKQSLRTLLKSPKVKQYVDKHAGRSGASVKPLPQSATMRHWSKVNSSSMSNVADVTSAPETTSEGANDDDQDADAEARKKEASHPEYGRNLILAESCRAAFCRDAENRSHQDLLALRTWFQKTKLKTCTDFESLQAVELTLLCRRMKLHAYYPNEVVFKQGDDGDALYIVFSGKVEVRVTQKVMGDFVEVVVCEMSKGEFFGERSLLNNEPRAATIVTKTATELVSICRDDYNVMLKQDQQAFLQKAAAAGGQRLSQIMLSNHDTYIKILKKKPSTRSKADLVTLATFLQTLKFFRGLPKTFVQELCTIIDLINVDANTTIFREGEVGKLFYVILSGAVDVKISAVDKRGGPMQTKLVNLGEGSHFGDLALMKKDGLRSATVVSTHACELLIIAEKDYNAILKKLQREDMEKRMALLDKIPIFQSVEWTSEIMKEVSYVLVEQRLPAGTVVYKQGDKAVHLYFLIRGEVIISQIVKDPKSLREHSVVVERLGPFNVLGDDAATGKNFNEAVIRSESATANTPIEVLVLSKYDVFNRLSRTARETLRGHTHRHKQPVVVFDQLYKTLKWDEYKAQVVRREVNVNRLKKVLPHTARFGATSTSVSQRGGGKHTPLIEGNELLLLSPIKHSTATPSKTLANYTVHYNPDVTTQDRKALLRAVVDAHAREAMKTLDEGNPMVYLDYLAPAALTSTSTAFESIMHPTDGVSENFIFSIPPSRKPNGGGSMAKAGGVASPDKTRASPKHLSSTTPPSNPTPPGGLHSRLRHVSPGFIVVNVAGRELYPVSPQPAFRIVGQFAAFDDAVARAQHVEAHENTHAYRSYAAQPDHPVEYFVVETARHVLVPPTMARLSSREYCSTRLHEYLHDHGNLNKLKVSFRQLQQGTSTILADESATLPRHEIDGIMNEMCGHLECLALAAPLQAPPAPNESAKCVKKQTLQLQDIEHSHMPAELKQAKCNFACVSTLLVGDASEPSLCVYGCYPTEAEATDFAENGYPNELSDQALLCVVPMYEWIYFEDASDWCLQMRKSQDRHNLAVHKKELHAIQQQPMVANAVSVAVAVPREAPGWMVEQQQGQRLHQLICSHMGVKSTDRDQDVKGLEDEAYTVKSSVTLEQKMDALHDILNARHQPSGLGTSLQKMQKVQRFGHIMKLRLHKAD